MAAIAFICNTGGKFITAKARQSGARRNSPCTSGLSQSLVFEAAPILSDCQFCHLLSVAGSAAAADSPYFVMAGFAAIAD
jgi:hypothetical protein